MSTQTPLNFRKLKNPIVGRAATLEEMIWTATKDGVEYRIEFRASRPHFSNWCLTFIKGDGPRDSALMPTLTAAAEHAQFVAARMVAA